MLAALAKVQEQQVLEETQPILVGTLNEIQGIKNVLLRAEST